MDIPATDADIPALVALINRAYRGDTGSGWSTEEAYLVGERTTDARLRDDLAKSLSLASQMAGSWRVCSAARF